MTLRNAAPILAVVLSLFICSPLLAQQAESDADLPAGAKVDESAVDPPPAEVTTSEPARESRAAGWMRKVDAFFGDYVVTPISAVIFYDFGTGEWLGVSIPFVVVWLLLGGIFLTLRMGFINIRGFGHAIRLVKGDYDDPNEPGEVSHFQALAAALSATVGLGNIAGVSIAIGAGGPGASFWIMIVGLLGMSAKFAECTLGQLYRIQDEDGHMLGGPMRYLRYGLAERGMAGFGRVLAVFFMVLCIGPASEAETRFRSASRSRRSALTWNCCSGSPGSTG